MDSQNIPRAKTRLKVGRSLTRRGLAGAALLLAGVALTGCWFRYYEWNQKVTVTVATPDGEVSGSAVSHMKTWIGKMPMTGNDQSDEFAGEATVLELQPGKYLFALIGEESKWLAWKAWKSSLPLQSKDETYAEIARKRESIVLPPKLYPLLVTFGDIRDPASVTEVNPADLAASFGPGFALTSITLEITDDPVTQGTVEKVLPWIIDYKLKQWRLNGKSCIACPVKGTTAEILWPGQFLIWGTK